MPADLLTTALALIIRAQPWPLSLLLGLVTTLLFVYIMNEGRKWFVNIKAQKEPALVGLGVFFILKLGLIGLLPGVTVILLGLGSRYTDYYNI